MPRSLERSSGGERFGRRHAQRGVRPGLVVGDAPALDDPAGLVETAAHVRIEAFVAEAAPTPKRRAASGPQALKLSIEPFCIGLPLRGLLAASPAGIESMKNSLTPCSSAQFSRSRPVNSGPLRGLLAAPASQIGSTAY